MYEEIKTTLANGNLGITPTVDVTNDPTYEPIQKVLASGKFGATPVWDVGSGGTGTDTGWIPLTLNADWENYNIVYGIPSYRVLNGVVYFKGLVKRTATGTGSVISILPENARPDVQRLFSVGNTGTTIIAALVRTNGSLEQSGTIAVSYLNLSQIFYPLLTAPSILTTAPNNDITDFALIGDILSIDMLSGTHKEVDLSNYINATELTSALNSYYTKVEEDNLLSHKADLDGTGTVPQSQLPSYVDDVLEFANLATFPVVGVDGKIYVAVDTNKTYRWTGSTYVGLDDGVVLGETSATAYRGDRGKIAYDHTFLTNNPHSITKSQVGLSNVDNTSDVNKPISTATQTALNGKANVNRGFVSVTLPYTALLADNYISSTTANGTLTLPSASVVGSGKMYSIKKNNSGAGNVTITPAGGQTIDGNSTLVLSGSSKPATRIVSDGANWIVF